jgi:Tat protein translocase TatB subunit
MFNVGGGEMFAILLLALIVLGPERLPKAMGQVGRYVAQMRKLSSGFQDEIKRAMEPIEAPFRPGEETLSGPVPSVTDEVRVVATGEPEPTPDVDGDAEAGPTPPVDLAKVDHGAPDASEGGTVTPLRPRADEGDGDRATG